AKPSAVATVSGRTATLAVSCARGANRCRGAVTLLSARGKRIGAKRFSLPAGAERAVKVKLSSAGARLLTGKRSLKARARVAVDGGSIRSFRLTLRAK
nr:hypothetical protein [Thermoleophilaceae bacterium]